MYKKLESDWKKRTILFLISQCITLFGSTLVQMAIMVCDYADIIWDMGSCIYYLFLSAAVFYFFCRRGVGGSI